MNSSTIRASRATVFSCAIYLTFWNVTVVSAINEEKLLKRTQKAESKFELMAENLLKEVRLNFEQEIRRAKRAGHLDLLEKLEMQLKSFDSDHRLPENIDTTQYRQRLTRALEVCLFEYNQAITEATKKDRALGDKLQAKRDQFDACFDREFPGARIKRVHWNHPNGDFKNIGGNDWHEELPGKRYAFKETHRDADCVYLFDQSRDLGIVLSASECAIVHKKSKPKTLYQGKWVN